jgi:hypothetical protein
MYLTFQEKHITNGIVFIQHYFHYDIDIHVLKFLNQSNE